jgi:hypothetical protein
MDCTSTSEAERASECGEEVQWPKDKNPIRFMTIPTYRSSLLFLFKACNEEPVSAGKRGYPPTRPPTH